MKNYIQELPGLYRISLVQKMEGFRDFVSSWLFMKDNLAFVVDPGPKYTINTLIESLKEIGVQHLDFILLTHIHIDHAGGAGRLLAEFPDARVICHPKGIGHMIDPERLWQGSLKVLGHIAESYGEIVPIPENSIQFLEEIPTAQSPIKVIETPGHAPHHLCYLVDGLLFAGEVAGISYTFDNETYRRPATPPKFKLEISLASLDRVLATNPIGICYGHFGYRYDAENALRTARFQLILWTDVIREQLENGEADLDKRVIAALLEKDPAFGVYRKLAPDIRIREDYFIGNTIDGIRGFLLEENR